MPTTLSISGFVHDQDDNPLQGVLVRITGPGPTIDSETTDVNGIYSFGPTDCPLGDYSVQCFPPDPTPGVTLYRYLPRNFLGPQFAPNPRVCQHTADGDDYPLTDFYWTGVVCFRRPSSWVWRVCWYPGRGVHVTFHKKGVPYFCAQYPGTTVNDYNLFKLAPSLGRHVCRWYYHRPYVPAPILLG